MKTQIDVVLFEMILGKMPPTVLVEDARGGVKAEQSIVDSILDFAGALIERTAGQCSVQPLKREPVLHPNGHRAAQRVQPIQRRRAQNIHPVDRDVRNEVPVDRVAEGLIDAHAILIDGDTLRGAEYRRRIEATNQNVRLKGVGQGVV